MRNIGKQLFRIKGIFVLFFAYFSLINDSKVIKIDNLINESLYQENMNFSKYKTQYKILAIYHLENIINEEDVVNKKRSNLCMQRKKDNNLNKSLIEKQIKLAKDHGIFGFGIVCNQMKDLKFNQEILNLFSHNEMDNFPFFIIISYNDTHKREAKNQLLQNIKYEGKGNEVSIFFDSIKKYFRSENYIKLEGKPILGIFHSPLIYQLISAFKKYDIENGKDRIYIIYITDGNKNLKYMKFFNSLIEFPSNNIGIKNNLNLQYYYNFYFPHLFKEKDIKAKIIRSFFIINGSPPEKFYIIFKKYLNLTCSYKYPFLLFNAWNNHKEKFFLEPNKEFGFSYLNYLSKALFNVDNDKVFNSESLDNKSKIAVQIHLFYDDLIKDIINKTNNIPIKFDLYVTITSSEIYKKLEKYIISFSKANYFEIMIAENKGRDILPFLNQIKTKYKFYKYLCHIHTKRSLTAPEIGFLWRNYLYNNLLGDINVVSEIIYDFDNNEKLGFLFPETYYGIINQFYRLTKGTKKWMNFLASKLFKNYKIGKLYNFPAGNMFWAKLEAISQIFVYDFTDYFPNEGEQTNDTIMHGIERIWLYLVKFNNFYYKTIFKYF